MANNDLLKEAIADAKAVKETAIANAKLALEEAFTPHLKSMLSAKLEEMDKEDVDEGYDEDVKEEMDTKDDMKEEKEDMDEAKEELDEINLDELLAELELDEDARTDAEEEGYKDGMKDEKEDLKEDERTDAEEEGYLDGEKDEKEDMEDKDDEEIDLEDMSEDDLKGFIEDVIKDLVADGTIEAGEEAMEDEEDVVDVEDVEDVEDVDIDVEIDEAKVEDLDEMSKKEKAEGDDRKKDDKIEDETEKMRFKEAIEEIEALKVELNEVNLLNAKLLYANKIFKSKNLTEDKKVKVLKAFDKVSTVKEAKVVFDTLNEGIVSKTKPTINNIKGSASKATGTITEAKKPIIESNDVYNRMRKLAGLI
jgi:uncharacterized protein YerC